MCAPFQTNMLYRRLRTVAMCYICPEDSTLYCSGLFVCRLPYWDQHCQRHPYKPSKQAKWICRKDNKQRNCVCETDTQALRSCHTPMFFVGRVCFRDDRGKRSMEKGRKSKEKSKTKWGTKEQYKKEDIRWNERKDRIRNDNKTGKGKWKN